MSELDDFLNEFEEHSISWVEESVKPKPIDPSRVVSSGNLAIDLASGINGFPRSRIIEVHGPESAGKTTIVLEALAQYIKRGERVLFLDYEHALDLKYAAALGCKGKNFIHAYPNTAEDGYRMIKSGCMKKLFGAFAFDSMASMPSRREIEGDIEDNLIGEAARIHSRGLRQSTGYLSMADATLFIINQERDAIGVMYGSKITTPGGKALKYYASMRLRITRTATNKEDDQAQSNATKVEFVKNKLAPPYTKATFDILFGQGSDYLSMLIDLAEEKEIIVKKGAWISYQGANVAQGHKKFREFLANPTNQDFKEELESKVLGKPTSKELAIAEEQRIEEEKQIAPKVKKSKGSKKRSRLSVTEEEVDGGE